MCGTFCTENDARTLFPVDTRNDEMIVQKKSILGEMYLFSDTVVCAFSETAFGDQLASMRYPKTPLIYIVMVAALSTRAHARLNMDQGHLINIRTVKFVFSCCVVSKQVEVNISVSVESAGPWLHAGTCPVFAHLDALHMLLARSSFAQLHSMCRGLLWKAISIILLNSHILVPDSSCGQCLASVQPV